VADYLIAAALFVFIVVVLVTLKRAENKRNREPGE
jgi:hypothetical protein